MKHDYFKVCEWCGAHLDPGEKCDCEKEKRREEPFLLQEQEEARPKSA